MNDFQVQRVAPKSAYDSFDDYDPVYSIVELNGRAFEMFIDNDLNEIPVLFSGVYKTKTFPLCF